MATISPLPQDRTRLSKCPGQDSNLHVAGFEPAPSANWGTRAPLPRVDSNTDRAGFKPAASAMAAQARPYWATRAKYGGGDRVRTCDLLLARQLLPRLSYTPTSPTTACGNRTSTGTLSRCCTAVVLRRHDRYFTDSLGRVRTCDTSLMRRTLSR